MEKEKQTYAEYFDFKPSAALQAMVNGLEMSDKERGFKIQMEIFGFYNREKKVCFGCAATSAIRATLNKPFPDRLISYISDRAKFAEASYEDFYVFEDVIDSIRDSMHIGKLFHYMKIYNNTIEVDNDWSLLNHNYLTELPKVKKYIKKIKKLGF